jgi:hypothetical protein
MIGRRGVLLAVAGLAAAGSGAASAAGHGRRWARDLEGVWTTASYTDLERPAELKALVLTEAEAEAYEAPRRAMHGLLPSKPGEVGQAENEWVDRGTGMARVKGQIRSSWIIDPPDGRIPYNKAALAHWRVGIVWAEEKLEDPEDLNGPERCLANMATGAPLAVAPDSNLFQVVQTRDHVVILTEKYHDARIVRMSDTTRPSPLPRSWLGDCIGRWDGDVLVVETEGMHAGVTVRGLHFAVSEATRVVERLTRSGPDELFYEFAVEDPVIYTAPWRGEMALRRAQGRIFEYACHEGNYSLPGILAGARRGEREAAGK